MGGKLLPDLGADLALVWVWPRRDLSRQGASAEDVAGSPTKSDWEVRRRLLATYLGVGPAAIDISRTSCGKPTLSGRSDLHFNSTRSATFEGFAIARAPVGVDLEEHWETPIDEVDGLAELVLSPREKEQFELLTPDMRRGFYLRCWTRREAYLKAVGDGLSHAVLPQTVIPESGAFAGLPPRTRTTWTVWEEEPFPGCFLAVVAGSPVFRSQVLAGGPPGC